MLKHVKSQVHVALANVMIIVSILASSIELEQNMNSINSLVPKFRKLLTNSFPLLLKVDNLSMKTNSLNHVVKLKIGSAYRFSIADTLLLYCLRFKTQLNDLQ